MPNTLDREVAENRDECDILEESLPTRISADHDKSPAPILSILATLATKQQKSDYYTVADLIDDLSSGRAPPACLDPKSHSLSHLPTRRHCAFFSITATLSSSVVDGPPVPTNKVPAGLCPSTYVCEEPKPVADGAPMILNL